MYIKKVEKLTNGLRITFKNVSSGTPYYSHGVKELGTETDSPSIHRSVWGWINHLRSKIWWHEAVETELLQTSKTYFQ